MSGHLPRKWVALDGVTDERLAILEENAIDWLVTKAADLPPVSDDEDWKREADEVAALGRMVTGLRRGQILPGDEIARKLAARTTSETITLDELREQFRKELGEHQAWAALLARYDTA